MNWQSIQQLIRLGAQMGASALATNGVIHSDMVSMASGVVVSVAAIVWWVVWERNRDNPTPPTV